MAASQAYDRVGRAEGPKLANCLRREPITFCSRLRSQQTGDGSGTWVSLALGISLRVIRFDANLLDHFRIWLNRWSEVRLPPFDFALVQQPFSVNLHPGFLVHIVVEMRFPRQAPRALAGVIEMHNLNRAREVQVGLIPAPFSAIGYHDFLFGTAPAALPSFKLDSLAQLFGGLERNPTRSLSKSCALLKSRFANNLRSA
jgi:hypothetical protein